MFTNNACVDAVCFRILWCGIGRPQCTAAAVHGCRTILKGTLYSEIQLQNVPLSKAHLPHTFFSVDCSGTIASWCQQICSGMAHLHKCGIYHRDLKPKNILIKINPAASPMPPTSPLRTGTDLQPLRALTTATAPSALPSRVVISDFGVSKQLQPNASEVSQMHTMAGTVVYMAPEILRGESSSKGSDVWSYGVVGPLQGNVAFRALLHWGTLPSV